MKLKKRLKSKFLNKWIASDLAYQSYRLDVYGTMRILKDAKSSILSAIRFINKHSDLYRLEGSKHLFGYYNRMNRLYKFLYSKYPDKFIKGIKRAKSFCWTAKGGIHEKAKD